MNNKLYKVLDEIKVKKKYSFSLYYKMFTIFKIHNVCDLTLEIKSSKTDNQNKNVRFCV